MSFLTVVVEGLPENAKEDTIKNLFESENRTGGGETSDVKVQSAARKAEITFVDPKGTCILF